MKLEYRAFRELDGDLPKEVIEYAKDEFRYKILQDNGINDELLKEINELLAYFRPKYDYTRNLLSTRTKRYIASWNGKKDFILMGMRAYEEIIMVLESRKKAIEHRIKS